MAENAKQLITMTRVNETGGYDTLYPRTVAENVFIDGEKTLADHVADTNLHINATERAALDATNAANGYLKLDEQGYVPVARLNPAVIAVNKEFANVAALIEGKDNVEPGQLVMVVDATADTTVDKGWAIYRKRVATGIDFDTINDVDGFTAATGAYVAGTTYYSARNIEAVVDTTSFEAGVTSVAAYFTYDAASVKASGWQKIAEKESLDVVVSWDSIQGKPTSTVAQIDDAVSQAHTHANLATLDKFGVDADSKLTYNGDLVAMVDSTFAFKVVDSENVPDATTLKPNDLVFVVTGTVTETPAIEPEP